MLDLDGIVKQFINQPILCQRPPLALAGPVSCFAKVNAKPVVPSFHVNPSRCITLVDLMVGTELCLQTNTAIDKRNCSCRISGRVINGHPLSEQKGEHLGTRQSTQHGHDQRIWTGALTRGERRPAESIEGPQRGAEEELRGGLPKSSVLTSLSATDVSAGRSG